MTERGQRVCGQSSKPAAKVGNFFKTILRTPVIAELVI